MMNWYISFIINHHNLYSIRTPNLHLYIIYRKIGTIKVEDVEISIYGKLKRNVGNIYCWEFFQLLDGINFFFRTRKTQCRHCIRTRCFKWSWNSPLQQKEKVKNFYFLLLKLIQTINLENDREKLYSKLSRT